MIGGPIVILREVRQVIVLCWGQSLIRAEVMDGEDLVGLLWSRFSFESLVQVWADMGMYHIQGELDFILEPLSNRICTENPIIVSQDGDLVGFRGGINDVRGVREVVVQADNVLDHFLKFGNGDGAASGLGEFVLVNISDGMNYSPYFKVRGIEACIPPLPEVALRGYNQVVCKACNPLIYEGPHALMELIQLYEIKTLLGKLELLHGKTHIHCTLQLAKPLCLNYEKANQYAYKP
jgi:hypothetical protein